MPRIGLNLFIVLICSSAVAAIGMKYDPVDHLAIELKKELTQRYPGAMIELTTEVHWVSGGLTSREITNQKNRLVQELQELQPGNIQFTIRRMGGNSIGQVGFAAWFPTWAAQRRILPGERLHSEMFSKQKVNIATGFAREFRGLIVPSDVELSGYESIQTILEGQFPMRSGIRKVPDLRRGEPIQIRLISGGIVLSTSGISEESAYLNSTVRVMAGKTKRQLVGKLLSEGVVEVHL